MRSSLPIVGSDTYAGIYSEDAFLSIDEEAAIIHHLDSISLALFLKTTLPYPDICDAGMLLCAYQFAMRPFQIAMLRTRDVRIWDDGSIGTPTSSLLFFHRIGQASGDRKKPVVADSRRRNGSST